MTHKRVKYYKKRIIRLKSQVKRYKDQKSKDVKSNTSKLGTFLLIMFIWIVAYVSFNLALNTALDFFIETEYNRIFILYCANGFITSFTFFFPIFYPTFCKKIKIHILKSYRCGFIFTIISAIIPILLAIIIPFIKLFVWFLISGIKNLFTTPFMSSIFNFCYSEI